MKFAAYDPNLRLSCWIALDCIGLLQIAFDCNGLQFDCKKAFLCRGVERIPAILQSNALISAAPGGPASVRAAFVQATGCRLSDPGRFPTASRRAFPGDGAPNVSVAVRHHGGQTEAHSVTPAPA